VEHDGRDLFTTVRSARGTRTLVGLVVSAISHALIAAAAVLAFALWPTPSPLQPDHVRALVFEVRLVRPPPPPPPPPPLARGRRPQSPERRSPIVVTPTPTPTTATLVAPSIDPPTEAKPAGEEGNPLGSDDGVAEGMEGGTAGGVPGGVVGGVPGGVLGGVLGGVGDGPILDYDRPPRILRMVNPEYPQEAFVKKVEGTVVIEIVIDANGRVVGTRMLRSIPLLDAAAIACVRQWVFLPAIKGGRPVVTIARAPVSFVIY
jgi:protein TonB